MIVLRIVDVFQPFLKLSMPADLVWSEFFTNLRPLPTSRLVDSQDFRSLDRVGQQIADELVVHRRAHDEAP